MFDSLNANVLIPCLGFVQQIFPEDESEKQRLSSNIQEDSTKDSDEEFTESGKLINFEK